MLSFAHLKNKKATTEKQAIQPPTSLHGHQQKKRPEPAQKSGVMNFAHLKKGGPVKPVSHSRAQKKEAIEEQQKGPKLYRYPSVAKTARIAAVNFCQHCPRFLPASENERQNGNPYGRCLRSGEDGSDEEVWKVIPVAAKVARCYYHINTKWRF